MAHKQSGGPASSRYARLGPDKPRKVVATWEEAEAQDLWRTICEVTAAGDAIMFGRTRDEGAVVLTVLSGDERVRQYATGADEIAELLKLVRESVEADS